MPCLKWQKQHCKDLAKKRKLESKKSYDISNDILNSDDEDSTEDEIEWIDDQIENEAECLFSVLIKNIKVLNLSNSGSGSGGSFSGDSVGSSNDNSDDNSGGYSSSRLGSNPNINSDISSYDNLGDIKNIQAFIDTIENKLKSENEHLTSEYKI
ncbi:7924_t:CDS:2 [Funneliformis caledonium]|uniref:7924_t:CDS:1 n=1 Tax=Funneliformis caledonium TaxID=1117310 RepID=A0A9N8YVU3_9GLOM|nr:7924_t:CDS:2 [Funneliformis caledonium]